MITKRLVILLCVILAGMGSVFLIPKFPNSQPMGVTLALPEQVGDWFGTDAPVTDKEKQVLGADTEFARKAYTNLAGDAIYVSVVLAGQDVTTSLHQPERCLPAQGWDIVDAKTERVPLNADGISSLKATRLHNVRPVTLSDGRSAHVFSLDYYWYIGYTDLCATPFGRSVIDWRDRLFKGYNQRWAYVTVVASVRGDSHAAEAQSDAMIKKFIAQLFPKIWKPGSVAKS